MFRVLLNYMRSGELDLPLPISMRAVQRDADFFLIPLPGKDNQRREKGEVIGYAKHNSRFLALFVSPGGMPAIQGILPKLAPFINQGQSYTQINQPPRTINLAAYFTESFSNVDYRFLLTSGAMSAYLAVLEILASAGFEVAGLTTNEDQEVVWAETLLVLRSK